MNSRSLEKNGRLEGVRNAQASAGRIVANRALIVAASPTIRIVIARTIERSYLKPLPVAPEAALNALMLQNPILVILDASTQDTLLDPLLLELKRLRLASEKELPRILLIGQFERQREDQAVTGLVDARVAKPITPDTLQPIIERLVNR